jgi:hypothetical protein
VARRIFCLLPSVLAGGFYFFAELFDSYLATAGWYDTFFLDSWLLLAFFVLTAAAAVGVMVGLFRRRKASIIACRGLFVISACLSFWFGFELKSLGDDVFFSLRESDFRTAVSAAGGSAATVVLHHQSDYNFNRLFVYSGSRSLPDGYLSLEDIDAFGGDLDPFRGCKVSARHLRDNFYILSINCG